MNESIIIVPTYNEAENILPLLKEITEYVPQSHILVVDDGSPDGTQDLVEESQKKNPNLFLLKRAKKDGLARAYIAGFDWALAKQYKRILQMDADFSHHPRYLPSLLGSLDTSALAIGSRYIKEGAISGWSPLRYAISWGGNQYARAILNSTVRDLTGGFNAWRRETLQTIKYSTMESRGYSFQVELKYRTLRAGLPIIEVPICFEDRTKGKSKMSGNIVKEAAWRVWELRFSKFSFSAL